MPGSPVLGRRTLAFYRQVALTQIPDCGIRPFEPLTCGIFRPTSFPMLDGLAGYTAELRGRRFTSRAGMLISAIGLELAEHLDIRMT